MLLHNTYESRICKPHILPTLRRSLAGGICNEDTLYKGIDICLVLIMRFLIFGRLSTVGKQERIPDSRQDCKCFRIFLVSKPALGFETPFV